jgi:inorganic pyrophosphatase
VSDHLRSGSIVECEPVGLLEQEETGQPDHKVLAVVAGQDEVIPEGALEMLQDFIYGVFSDYPEETVSVGPIRSREAALRYIRNCQDV